MLTLEQICESVAAVCPGAKLTLQPNPAVGAELSLVVDATHLVPVAVHLRNHPGLRLDYCSNVTGVDWLDSTAKVKVRKVAGDGTETEVEETRHIPGYLEVVYHLYSMELKHGPVVVRVRTADRGLNVLVPSLTPVWRSCELQEREVYDLFGVQFEGHPDLRRLLMWDEFRDHPMRKDYVSPDDFEYEPTPHDEVLDRVRSRGGEVAP